jgi:hypothetical protein
MQRRDARQAVEVGRVQGENICVETQRYALLAPTGRRLTCRCSSIPPQGHWCTIGWPARRRACS